MLKDVMNKDGNFIRELPDYFIEMYVDVPDDRFEDIKEVIEYWGILYCGEPKIDDRQVTDFMRKRKVENYHTAERILYRRGRIALRQPFFDEMRKKKIGRMSQNVQLACEILYRSGLIEVAI